MITKPFASVLLALTALPAWAASPGCVVLEDGWIRLPPMPAMPMAAGFGTIRNRCDAPVTVTAVRSADVREVSLHKTTQVDGVSRMREVEQLPIAAGSAAELRPGGLHLMLTRDDRALQDGQHVAVQLVLDDGSEVPAELVVRKAQQ
jgi:copper(I)-binding protein